jgi:hypothetical protein
VEVQLYPFLTSATRTGRFYPGVKDQWIGGWVSPRAGLDAMVKRKNHITDQENDDEMG